MRRILSILTLTALAAPAAGAPILSFPLACELGETCYIQQYMDHDPSEKHHDFRCEGRSYNTHKGTDFAVPTSAHAKVGVNILAAAAGTVMGTRNDMPDVWDGKFDAAAIKGRDCGNGLVIDHGNGWQTQYCHMREGSVAVSRGDLIASGAVLGQIGMSGRTQFPHLHLSVRKDGQPVDPFAPNGSDCDAPSDDTLWDVVPLFQEGGFLDIGFIDKVPEYRDIKLGEAQSTLTRISPALVSYVYLFGGNQGDQVEITFTGPGEFRVNETYELPKTLAQFYRAIGKKRRSAPWPGGTYEASATLTRDGTVIDQISASFEIPR